MCGYFVFARRIEVIEKRVLNSKKERELNERVWL